MSKKQKPDVIVAKVEGVGSLLSPAGRAVLRMLELNDVRPKKVKARVKKACGSKSL